MTNYWRKLATIIGINALLLSMSALGATENRQQSHKVIVDAVHEACQSQAKQRGYDNVAVNVHPLSAQMQLPRCPQTITTILPQPDRALGPVSIGVRCDSPDVAWTIYARAEVSALQPIPVLNRPLTRGDIISEADIRMDTLPARAATRGVALSSDQVLGRELLRAVDAGAPLRLQHLRMPDAVKQGQIVMLVARGNGVEIKVKGKAQHAGAVGEPIRVTNLSSGQTVQGVIENDGTIGIY